MRTRTLEERIDQRWYRSGAGDKLFLVEHIRAELQRVARQIRKLRRDDLKDPTRSQSTERTYSEGLTEALALIRKATR